MNAYQVPTSSLPLLQDPPFVLWLLVLGAGLGRRCLTLLRLSGHDTRLERGLVSAALGLGLLQYLAFGLGMAGWLTPSAIWMGLGLLTLVALPDMYAVLRALFAELQRLRSEPPPRIMIWGALLLCVPLGVALLAALSPPIDEDGLFYHLTGPKRWLQLGRLAYLPTLVHTNSLLGVNMLYTLALAVWSDTAAKLIHFGFGILALLSIFALGRRVKGSWLGYATASLWMIGLYAIPTLDASRLFSWAYVDLGLTTFSMCAVLSWLLWSRSGDRGWFVAAALCAGFAATTKLTGVFVGAGLTLVVFVDSRRLRQPWARTATASILFGTLALLPAFPWFVRSYLQTGSPVYLMFPKLFRTLDWSPEAGAAFADYFKYYVWGTGYRSLHWPLDLRKALRAAVMVGTLGGASLLILRLKNWEHRVLIGLLAALTLACVSSTGLYVRYLVPFLPLGLVLALYPFERSLREKPWAQLTLLAFLGFNSLLYLRGAVPSIQDAALAATGRLSRETFLERQNPVAALWSYTNRVVPRNARILFAAGRPSYYLDPYCFLTEAYYQERIRMNTWDNFLADVRRDKLEYALLPARKGQSAAIGPEYAASKNELPFAHRLVMENGRLLKTVGTDSLYKLDGL